MPAILPHLDERANRIPRPPMARRAGGGSAHPLTVQAGQSASNVDEKWLTEYPARCARCVTSRWRNVVPRWWTVTAGAVGAEGDDHTSPAEPRGNGNRSPDADRQEVTGRPAHPVGRQRQRVKVGNVIAAAARAGRRYWLQLLALAIPVSLVGAGLEIVIDHYVDPSDALLSVGAALGSTGVTLLGTVLLSGFVCRLVGAAEHGQGAMTFLRVARS